MARVNGRLGLRKRTFFIIPFVAALFFLAFLAIGLHRHFHGAKNGNGDDASGSNWPWSTPALADNPLAASAVVVLTYHNDVARTGQNLEEKILTPANVNSTGFGKLGFMEVNGLVDAEPLYVSSIDVGRPPAQRRFRGHRA